MISHNRAEELISARLDAPLTPAEHRELQSHLASCTACRVFAGQTDELMHDVQTLSRLAASPAVSRAVMAAISTEETGWAWLGRILQTLSSPGLAVASGLALVVALSGALFIALNTPSGGNTGMEPESTIAAAAYAPVPTKEPTLVPTLEPTLIPTTAPSVAPTKVSRSIAPAPTEAPRKTPTPESTATQPPIQLVESPTDVPLQASNDTLTASDQPSIEEAADDPALAMAPEDAVGSAELAQGADEAAPPDVVAEEAQPSDSSGQDESGRKGGRKNSAGKDSGDGDAAAADAPQSDAPPAESAPIPDESIVALVTQGDVPDVNLPPAAPPPMVPMAPDQSFLPETPTPTGEGTPTPESDGQTDSPQLAEDTSGQLGVTALAPDVTDNTTVDEGKEKNKDKKDKSGKDGKTSESQQTAYTTEAMGWSSQPIDFSQPEVLYQTTDDGTYDSTGATEDTSEVEGTIDPATGYEIDPTTGYPIDPATGLPFDPATGNLIDPATGFAIDPETGLLIDPATGYLLDLVNHRIIDPKTGFEVHPITGLLIDPVTGAQLDPITHAIVIPAGFGSDQPDYQPGSDMMRGEIESVVDNTYDSASIKLEPPTDGPSQPIDPINIAPTESGDAVEIS